ncbi:hypothetical protein ACFQ68_30940, partial [Amycolatopsis japonica]|uniref:hypothetical protein n=1 Tax=Amycolatopsis japonica TaxID=208439 RepID=UPI00366BB12F
SVKASLRDPESLKEAFTDFRIHEAENLIDVTVFRFSVVSTTRARPGPRYIWETVPAPERFFREDMRDEAWITMGRRGAQCGDRTARGGGTG